MFNISQVMLKLQGGMFNMTGVSGIFKRNTPPEQGRFNLPITNRLCSLNAVSSQNVGVVNGSLHCLITIA